MNKRALAQLFYRESEKLIEAKLPPQQLAGGAYRILNLLFLELTRAEKLQFTTLFSRIAYISQKQGLSKQLQYFIHQFRKAINKPKAEIEAIDQLGLKVLVLSIKTFLEEEVPASLADYEIMSWPIPFKKVKLTGFKSHARVIVLEDFPTKNIMLIKDEAAPEEQYYLQYDLPERNDNFNPTIAAIRKSFEFPVILELIDVEIDEFRNYRPRAIVIEPDYLMDVSAVAECFKPSGTIPELFLLKKFLPFQVSRPLIIGNIANFFLDELMRNPQAIFKEVFVKAFRLFPLTFSVIEDAEIRTIMQMSQKHFVNLRKVILKDFQAEGIVHENAYLEPSFHGPKFGLQGRLDVLSLGERKAIVELKSGKVFKPNIYGISVNHYTQTLLYDLIIRSVYGKTANPVNYILYSGADDNQLRFAPVVKAQQYEALNLRNQMLALERDMMNLGNNAYLHSDDWIVKADQLFRRIQSNRYPQVKGFVKRDMDRFVEFYAQMGSLEKKYFIAFSGLIAREHRLAKTGTEQSQQRNGQAALWLNSYGDKEEGFHLLAQLKLEHYQLDGGDPLIRFSRSKHTNLLANFRNGDIAVLYPYQGADRLPVENQIFKGTIFEINEKEVLFQLRSAQFNDQLFKQFETWNLEHDLLDSGFNNMYRSLFSFFQAPKRKRKLLLGTIAPAAPMNLPIEKLPEELSFEQQDIFKKLLNSQDYFLLWGPPGTGKTSIMLKNITGYLMEHSEDNIMLLAYTNRAVDEMCEAIEKYDPKMRGLYLRIGSRYSTAPAFRDRLLSVQSEKIHTRKELKALVKSHRLFVGTVASVAGKPELFQLKHFHRVLIDEASQVLEPMLLGILPQFDHFTLIGDHKQLPAVVTQDPEVSAIDDADLHSIGLNNLRNSLFERLFKLCVREAWEQAYAQLSHQGRMHSDIMGFPNEHFYQFRLNILPESIAHHQKQISPIPFSGPIESDIDRLIYQQRVIFAPAGSEIVEALQKTNRQEALLAAQFIMRFKSIYEKHNLAFSLQKIGIITPFRAQIAMIKKVLNEEGLNVSEISIDTVERYQGGARDIIIISLCTNSLQQLSSMISLSEEGVDRKLNVALTRAREYLILLGNPDLLKQNPIYERLLEYCG